MTGTPTLFLLVGLPGSGKTTIARRLESERRAVRFSPDEWMLPLFGASDPHGERDILEGRFIWTAYRVLLAGADAILDFGMWSRDERAALRAVADIAGARHRTVFCDLEEIERGARIRRRQEKEPDTTFVMTDADHARHRQLFQPPTPAEIAGDEPRDPPRPHTDWLHWAADRWPSLPVLRGPVPK